MKILNQTFKGFVFFIICLAALIYLFYFMGIYGLTDAKNYQTKKGRANYGTLAVFNFAVWAVTLMLIIKK